eukprot:GHVR01037043.1.p2 GENE.GHVR01037043.1~~GHVR01037043.1.p2  ORF type:complete len:130 (+),score=19.21 GHVR01037043.1:1181-1570(+)
MQALMFCKTDVARLLIEKGSDVNFENKFRKTALFLACEEGNLGIVKLVIKKGADINHKDNAGRTPVMVAATYGYPDVVSTLFEAMDHVNSEHGNILTPSELNERSELLDKAEQEQMKQEDAMEYDFHYY